MLPWLISLSFAEGLVLFLVPSSSFHIVAVPAPHQEVSQHTAELQVRSRYLFTRSVCVCVYILFVKDLETSHDGQLGVSWQVWEKNLFASRRMWRLLEMPGVF